MAFNFLLIFYPQLLSKCIKLPVLLINICERDKSLQLKGCYTEQVGFVATSQQHNRPKCTKASTNFVCLGAQPETPKVWLSVYGTAVHRVGVPGGQELHYLTGA